jgi:nitroreductase
MEKPAPTPPLVHDLIRRRWSPLAFDSRPVEPEKLAAVLEAARWAASSYNEQPWRFLVATRDDSAGLAAMLGCLVEGNQPWAKEAPVLILSVAKRHFDRNNTPNRHSWHDVGAATAQLTLQAVSMGLFVHSMAGILPDKARAVFGVPEGFEVVAGHALGYPGNADALPDAYKSRESAGRSRLPLSQLAFHGTWGQPLTLPGG